MRHQLSSYFSALHRTTLVSHSDQPDAMTFEGALLFIDITGFTKLTDRFAEEGARGAERLSYGLDRYFGRALDAVTQRGGDVVAMAGDSILAVWRVERSEHLGYAVMAAEVAAGDVHAMVSEPDDARPTDGEIQLEIRASIGVGTFRSCILGGREGRWVPLVTGQAFQQVAKTDKRLQRGPTELSTEAATAARSVEPSVADDVLFAPVDPATPSVDATPAIESAVPEVVRSRLAAGQHEYLAEFRSLSILFVGLGDTAGSSLQDLQALTVCLQDQVSRFGGHLHQLLADDKGTTAIAAFGLPPSVQDRERERAARAALALRDELAALGYEPSIGIATGTLFCGSFGSERRRQYSLVGPTINTAARLMGAAARGSILCDEATTRDDRGTVDFEPLPPVELKGRGSTRIWALRSTRTEHTRAVAMVGREAERQALAGSLGRGGIAVVRGDAGLGKTVLLSCLDELAESSGVVLYRTRADAHERTTSLYAFRRATAKIAGTTRQQLESLLRDSADTRELLPLINALLPLELEDNDLTRQMTGQTRAENLRRLLVALYGAALGDRRWVLAIEDIHWMDSASLDLVVRLHEAFPNLRIVVSTRHERDVSTPGSAPSPVIEAHRQLLAAADQLIDLAPLSHGDVRQIVARQLEVESLDERLLNYIVERSEGHPFFSEELALAMDERDLIERRGRVAYIDESALSRSVDMPASIREVVTSRIDRLSAPVQLTLKVASVVGRIFERDFVRSIHPIEADRTGVPQHLATATSVELLRTGAGLEQYIFRHAIVHEATYQLLAFAQRLALHEAAALRIEHEYGSEHGPVQARLAEHWWRAERDERAIPYLARAGRQALDAYANAEAVEFLTRALTLDEKVRGRQSGRNLRQAHWHQQIGEAKYALADFDTALDHYSETLRLTGFRSPTSNGWMRPLELTSGIVKHLVVRRRAPRAEPLTGDDAEACRIALRALNERVVVCLWQGDRVGAISDSILAANIAARLGPAGDSAFPIAQLGYMLALVGLRKVAERDLRRSVEMAEASGGLLPTVMCTVVWGMFLSFCGRYDEALPVLQRGYDLAMRLGAGLWKHRSCYTLAEPILAQARFERAAELYAEASVLSEGAERAAVGLAHALKALCMLRLGQVERAVRYLEETGALAVVRESPDTIHYFSSIGVEAELLLAQERYAAAFEVAEEGQGILAEGNECSSYFTGVHGHYALLLVYLTLWERMAAGESPVAGGAHLAHIKSRVRTGFARFTQFMRQYPCSRPRFLLLQGRHLRLAGRRGPALKSFREALRIAESMDLPMEVALAHYQLALDTRGEAQRAHRDTAISGFETLGMRLEYERAAAVSLA